MFDLIIIGAGPAGITAAYEAKQAGLDEASAEDTAQDVFATLVKELSKFEYDQARGNFRSWLKTITVRKVRDAQRKKQPQVLGDDVIAAFEPLDEESLSKLWDQEYHELLVQQALRVMQNSFEEKTWRACWETTVNSRPAKEVGIELGISEASVFVAKSRVLRRLREELAGLMDDK